MKEVTVEGRQPVLEALKAGREISIIYIAEGEGKILQEIEDRAAAMRVRVEHVKKSELERMAVTGSPQGIVALAKEISFVDVQDLLDAAAEEGEDPFLLALDQLQDPQNFGSIIRTAEAVGAHGIVIPMKHTVTVTPGVEKTSAGALHYLPVAQANIAQALDLFKSRGCWIIGSDAEARDSCFEYDLRGPLVLVIGSEGGGLRRLVKQKCDAMVSIPMFGRINSLNAANAASILMYEVRRQRLLGKG